MVLSALGDGLGCGNMIAISEVWVYVVTTQVISRYPQIRTVVGDLDSSELIEEEVKNADIVPEVWISHNGRSGVWC
jgi:hypothetical protein